MQAVTMKVRRQELSQMVAFLEPVMILAMSLIVGSIVMAIMMPVFTMYTSML